MLERMEETPPEGSLIMPHHPEGVDLKMQHLDAACRHYAHAIQAPDSMHVAQHERHAVAAALRGTGLCVTAVELFGSSGCGLATTGFDVDVSVSIAAAHPDDLATARSTSSTNPAAARLKLQQLSVVRVTAALCSAGFKVCKRNVFALNSAMSRRTPFCRQESLSSSAKAQMMLRSVQFEASLRS